MPGVLFTLASALAFAFSNLLVKYLSTKVPAFELAFIRSVGGVVLALVAWRAFLRLCQLKDPKWHLIRAAVGAVSLVSLVQAYSSLPAALVTAVMYVRIPLVVILQWVILREGSNWRVWLAAGVGIVGALVALWPRLLAVNTPDWSWGVVWLAFAAVAGAGSQIAMRRLARTNPAAVVVAVSAILISAVVAIPASTVAITPPAVDLKWLIGMALLSAGAQWATVSAYKYATPAVLMPVTLVEVPLVALTGYLWFGETLSAYTLVGGSVVIGAALYVTRASVARG
ncbi:DMT family transporter [Azospirillum doebereinerae]|uniref:DMT family transporter n=1 Tax=Azospirillum doebereinerae TaxID=92933 RepID=UPI001EE62B7D|nr:DMT family transporter [Azospirillum doebereinerae]MCG5239557.1 DMT family transporter [Azospirillum doebereinerae]